MTDWVKLLNLPKRRFPPNRAGMDEGRSANVVGRLPP